MMKPDFSAAAVFRINTQKKKHKKKNGAILFVGLPTLLNYYTTTISGFAIGTGTQTCPSVCSIY